MTNQNSWQVLVMKALLAGWLFFNALPRTILPRPEHFRQDAYQASQDSWVTPEGFRNAFAQPMKFLLPFWLLLIPYVLPRSSAIWISKFKYTKWLRDIFWTRFYDPFTIWEFMAYISAYAGCQLRQWSYDTLGREFTYFVRAPNKLIRSGPYHWLVHPSYTAIVMVLVPVFFVAGCRGVHIWLVIYGVMSMLLALRISNEEAVMRDAFPQDFDPFVRSRWRLVPFLF